MGKDQPLRGKLAIVTGSSKPSGIGAATAVALAEQGANVRVHFFDFGCYRALPLCLINSQLLTSYHLDDKRLVKLGLPR